MKGSNSGMMPENPKQNEGIESRRDAGEPETNEGIESGRDVREPKITGRDKIQVRYRRTQNKMKGSNPGAMLENPKQNKGIESWRNARELKTK